MAKIIVGVNRSERTRDALALGAMLSRATGGAPMLLVHGYPLVASMAYTGTAEYDRAEHEESDAFLEELAATLDDDLVVETRSLPGPTPARALHELAEREGASLIVVGSHHAGRRGRVLPGSTGQRLLHGSPCPVAIAPHDFAARGDALPQVIGCAWDTGAEAEAALTSAAELASSIGARLRVIRVAPKPAQLSEPILESAWPALVKDMHEEAGRELEERMADLPADLDAEAVLREDSIVAALIAESGSVDLLVMGSRGYGPLRSVILGGVSGAVIRDASCPVLVVPRGVRLETPAPGHVRTAEAPSS
jgi:nucleotide-binding universal stress UspA family protein